MVKKGQKDPSPLPATKPVAPNSFGQDHTTTKAKRVPKVGVRDNGTRSGVHNGVDAGTSGVRMDGGDTLPAATIKTKRRATQRQAALDETRAATLAEEAHAATGATAQGGRRKGKQPAAAPNAAAARAPLASAEQSMLDETEDEDVEGDDDEDPDPTEMSGGQGCDNGRQNVRVRDNGTAEGENSSRSAPAAASAAAHIPPAPERSSRAAAAESSLVADLIAQLASYMSAPGEKGAANGTVSTNAAETGGKSKTKSSVKLPSFDGVSINWEAYLNLFNTAREHEGWSAEEAGVQLRLQLRGRATDALINPESKTWPYEKLVEELQLRFSASALAEHYQFQIRTRKRQKGETLSQLHNDFKRLGLLAYPTEQQTSIYNQVMVEGYIQSLSATGTNLDAKVRDRFPKNLNEAYQVSVLLEGNELYHSGAQASGKAKQHIDDYACAIESNGTDSVDEVAQLRNEVRRLKEDKQQFDTLCAEVRELKGATATPQRTDNGGRGGASNGRRRRGGRGGRGGGNSNDQSVRNELRRLQDAVQLSENKSTESELRAEVQRLRDQLQRSTSTASDGRSTPASTGGQSSQSSGVGTTSNRSYGAVQTENKLG